ncbi:MAG TPA: ATP-binding protein [bacterium]|nr:ATP-binding protein [bacterium]
MRIAIASGKGGTGKTTIATCLASLLATRGERVTYVDCDAEEPNGHLILQPSISKLHDFEVSVVAIDEEKCTGCGRCSRACQFHALACLNETVTTFPQLCHSCGACSLVCPEDAIVEVLQKRGIIREGHAGPVGFVGGEMSVGEESVTPVIRAVKESIPNDGTSILDAPPGTACPAVEAMRGSDRVLLVTEPTPFGLNDLKLAVATAGALGIPADVVINRCDVGTTETQEYCRDANLDILLEIPNDRAVAEAYSRGILPTAAVPGFRETMLVLVDRMIERIGEPSRA